MSILSKKCSRWLTTFETGSTPLHLRAEIEIIYSDHSGRVLCGESCRRGAKQKHKNHQEPYSGNLSSRYGRGSQDGMMPIILSSNSQKVTNLSNGEADISFKIPCPCGKHKEKTGYRLVHTSFTLYIPTSDTLACAYLSKITSAIPLQMSRAILS